MKTAWETFSLDATTFTHRARYLAWAQHEPGMDNNTAVWLSKMADPLTLTGPQIRLTTPEYDWERIGFKVNEGRRSSSATAASSCRTRRAPPTSTTAWAC